MSTWLLAPQKGVLVLAEKYDRAIIGKRIRMMRLNQGLTVQGLAKNSKVSTGYISEVERGLPAVSVDKLAQIADALGIGLDTLLSDHADEAGDRQTISIPAALSKVADELNLSHRATLTLLQGQKSLTARRSTTQPEEWGYDDWMKFYEQVRTYLPDC